MAWMATLRALINRHRGALDAAWLAGLSALCVALAESNLGTWLFGILLTLHLGALWSWIVRGNDGLDALIVKLAGLSYSVSEKDEEDDD